MYLKHIFGNCKRFMGCEAGSSSIQLAAYFGALALAVSLVGVPVLNKATKEYADSQSYGIDQTITGSIGKNDNTKPVVRYTIRKSVLDQEPFYK